MYAQEKGSGLATMVEDKVRVNESERETNGEIEVVHSLEDYILKDNGLVVEIFGIPKSGKSWHTKNVLRALSANPEFMDMVPDFSWVVYKDDVKGRFSKDPRYEFHKIKVLHHASNLTEVRHGRRPSNSRPRPVDLVISDRGPIDDNHWAYALNEEREITLEERENVLDISRRAESLVHAGVLVYVDTEEALRREHEDIREVADYRSRRGRVMNHDTLEILSNVYSFTRDRMRYPTINRRQEPEEVRITTRQVFYIDTTPPDSKEYNAMQLYNFFFELFVPTRGEHGNNGKGSLRGN